MYIEAHEPVAAAVYYARFDMNPYAPGSYGDAQAEIMPRDGSFIRASAHDRNVHLVTPRGGSYAQSLLDETQPEHEGVLGTLSVADLLADTRSYEIIRAGDISEADLRHSGEELKLDAADSWDEYYKAADEYKHPFDPWGDH